VSDATPEPAPDAPRPLPRREPRPLLVHAAVDVVVAFLALAVVLLILNVDIWTIVVVSIVVGLVAAPFTRRAEERALAQRPEA